MSAQLPFDPDEAMLARLAELDMALAEKLHALALQASDPEAAATLARAYQRIARSLRQTLALKRRLKADKALTLKDQAKARLAERKAQAASALRDHLWTEYERDEALDLESDLVLLIDTYAERPDFPDLPLSQVIAHLAHRLGVPLQSSG